MDSRGTGLGLVVSILWKAHGEGLEASNTCLVSTPLLLTAINNHHLGVAS